jgi:hypothetical protein
MGWLFAVGLGMQERRRAAVAWSLVPITVGHALAIAVAIAAAGVLGIVMSPGHLKWIVAAALFAFGGYRFFRHRHPKGGGMRVGFLDLTLWSFLMASAHGAGLMVRRAVRANDRRPAIRRTLTAPVCLAGRRDQHRSAMRRSPPSSRPSLTKRSVWPCFVRRGESRCHGRLLCVDGPAYSSFDVADDDQRR